MNDLVFMHGLNEEPYTTDKIIAECSNNQSKVVKNLIRNHKNDLEEFGILHFQNAKLPGRGRPQKTYHLNEQQATLLITYLDNTSQVNQFKKNLVREFYRMKKELAQLQINRAIEKPQRKTLMDAIKEWPQANQWSYRNATELLCKQATGISTKGIKKSRNVDIFLDGLTKQEQERYSKLENILIGLIGLNKSRDEVKAIITLAK
jgi:phage regulator Rha-like protein